MLIVFVLCYYSLRFFFMILRRTEKNVVFLIYKKKQANSVSKFSFIQHQHIVKRFNHFKKYTVTQNNRRKVIRIGSTAYSRSAKAHSHYHNQSPYRANRKALTNTHIQATRRECDLHTNRETVNFYSKYTHNHERKEVNLHLGSLCI